MKNSKLSRLILKLGESQQEASVNQPIISLNDEFSARIYGGRLPDTNANCTNGTCSNSLCGKLDAPKNGTCTNDHCCLNGMENTSCTNSSCTGGPGEL